MYVRRTEAEFSTVRRLQRAGISDAEIARRTGIARATLRRWRAATSLPRSCRKRHFPGWRPPDPPAYSYLLGLYLGDGCLFQPPRGFMRLALCLDGAYPGILDSADAAMRKTAPEATVHRNRMRASRAVLLIAGDPVWPYAFPQHGSGRKHRRRIWLADWQKRITRRHPKELIRGLIHSDGARCVNRFRTRLPSGRVAEYAYPRYFFSNLSADIRQIFCEHCELLGIRWTQSNHRNISVSHRDSVALLDSFVGPKR